MFAHDRDTFCKLGNRLIKTLLENLNLRDGHFVY